MGRTRRIEKTALSTCLAFSAPALHELLHLQGLSDVFMLGVLLIPQAFELLKLPLGCYGYYTSECDLCDKGSGSGVLRYYYTLLPMVVPVAGERAWV